ncbi:unnamed protein product [Lymnaea stagnalis]|uniref:HP domain-containing protein n=1 Tax=Lymnaea stagnalis TaxID=6523 RepID=A0AAV2HXJ5_LYMST
MKDQKLISLDLEGSSYGTAHYGPTLTEVLGHSSPSKNSLRSLECIRLTPTKPHRISSASNRSLLTRSRLTSARSFSTSARSKKSSDCSSHASTLGSKSLQPITSHAVDDQEPRSRHDSVAQCSETSLTSQGTNQSHCSVWSSARSHSTLFSCSSLATSKSSVSLQNLNLTQTGLTVWCLEFHGLVTLDKHDHGFFHQGNCYIILEINVDGVSYLHLWYGSQSDQCERDLARSHLDWIDKSLSGASFLSIECEGFETTTFMAHFSDGIVITEGKSKQLLDVATNYAKRLYHVKGRRFPTATCMEVSAAAATDDNVLILDGYPRIYVYGGKNVDCLTKMKAMDLARKINRQQRNGKAHIIVIDEEELRNKFRHKLDPNIPCDRLSSIKSDQHGSSNGVLHLYKVNGNRPQYDIPIVSTSPLLQKYLSAKDTFLLDVKSTNTVYLWVGRSINTYNLYQALLCGEAFNKYHDNSPATAICRIRSGEEPVSFKKCFQDWKEFYLKDKPFGRCYNAAIMERVLFSRSNHTPVGKFTENASDDDSIFDEAGFTEIWACTEILLKLRVDKNVAFERRNCYLIYCGDIQRGQIGVIFYWLGEKASEETKRYVQNQALNYCNLYGQIHPVIRVLDGKEPSYFLKALGGSITVYDADPEQDITMSNVHMNFEGNKAAMFCVRELTKNGMRISQVTPATSSLNSSATFIIVSCKERFLWFGKSSSAREREHAKTMLIYLYPENPYDYKIIAEGREPPKFWTVIHYDGIYPSGFSKPMLHEGLPKLVWCCSNNEKLLFKDIEDFSAKDLFEEDFYILDAHDRLFLWIGRLVPDDDLQPYILSYIINAYIKHDPARRNDADLQISFVNQAFEPKSFTKYFKQNKIIGSNAMYFGERKKLRQENALIDIDAQLLETSHLKHKKVPYKDLIKGDNLPAYVDRHHREHHLPDEEFTKVMKMPRTEFYQLPQWKQSQILKSARLF